MDARASEWLRLAGLEPMEAEAVRLLDQARNILLALNIDRSQPAVRAVDEALSEVMARPTWRKFEEAKSRHRGD